MAKEPATESRVRLIGSERRARVGRFFRLTTFKFSYWVHHLRSDTPGNNRWSDELERADFYRGDAVAALLHRVHPTQGHEIMLTRQYRFSTIINPDTGDPDPSRNGYMYELMAGMGKPREPWLETLRRETKEETGYDIEHEELIGSFYPSPGACSEQIHLYYAKVKAADAATEARTNWGVKSEQEDIERISKSPSEFLQMIECGEIVDAKCIAAAEWLRRGNRLRELFSTTE